MNKATTIKSNIFRQILDSKEHTVFFISDFDAAAETVRKVLWEATEQNMLEHIAHGIYVRPKHTRFGHVPVPMELIAKEIAIRDHAQIIPTGSTAANILGLSTQIPMVVSYITTGSTRTIKIGNRAINFRHAAPRNFSFKGTTMPLIVQALKEIGQDNIGDNERSILSTYLATAKDKETFTEDIRIAPQWIQAIVKPLINCNS